MKFIVLPITERFCSELEDEIQRLINGDKDTKEFNSTCLVSVEDISHAIGADNGTTTLYLINGETLVVNIAVGKLSQLLN